MCWFCCHVIPVCIPSLTQGRAEYRDHCNSEGWWELCLSLKTTQSQPPRPACRWGTETIVGRAKLEAFICRFKMFGHVTLCSKMHWFCTQSKGRHEAVIIGLPYWPAANGPQPFCLHQEGVDQIAWFITLKNILLVWSRKMSSKVGHIFKDTCHHYCVIRQSNKNSKQLSHIMPY